MLESTGKKGGDYFFVHNPLADNPIDGGKFKFDQEWIAEP